MDFQFTPTDGLRNVSSFPTDAASEAAARDYFQSLLDQIRDYLNSVPLPTLVIPTFTNSWNQRAGYQKAGYFIDMLGFVHLQGHISAGTFGQAAFQLPVGTRPLPADGTLGDYAVFVSESGNSACVITIDKNGYVIPANGATNADVSMNIAPFIPRG